MTEIGPRERKLQRRQERERAHRLSETVKQREERLRIAILFDGPLALRAHNRLSISDNQLQIAQACPPMFKHLSSIITRMIKN